MHPLHLLLKTFEPKDWVFRKNFATHPMGYRLILDCSTRTKRVYWREADDDVVMIAEWFCPLLMDAPQVLLMLSQRLCLEHDLLKRLRRALIDAPAQSWFLEWDEDTVHATYLDSRDQRRTLCTPVLFSKMIGPALYAHIVSFQNRSFLSKDPDDLECYHQRLSFDMPSTAHERLELL